MKNATYTVLWLCAMAALMVTVRTSAAPVVQTQAALWSSSGIVAESLRRCSTLAARTDEDGSECKDAVKFEARLIQHYLNTRPAITGLCLYGINADRGATMLYDTETVIQCVEG